MVRTEKMKESDKKYYLKNKEKIKERVRQYELRNREKTLKRKKEYDKKYYLKNKKRMNEQMRKILKKHYREDPEFRKHALQQGKNRKRNYRFFWYEGKVPINATSWNRQIPYQAENIIAEKVLPKYGFKNIIQTSGNLVNGNILFQVRSN